VIKRGSEQFSGYNKPKATPSHPTKSHAVLAKSGEDIKLIRFGQQGAKGSADGTKRNEAFKARHAENISKGKMSAAWWASKVKW
jgi:hypothetical protein